MYCPHNRLQVEPQGGRTRGGRAGDFHFERPGKQGNQKIELGFYLKSAERERGRVVVCCLGYVCVVILKFFFQILKGNYGMIKSGSKSIRFYPEDLDPSVNLREQDEVEYVIGENRSGQPTAMNLKLLGTTCPPTVTSNSQNVEQGTRAHFSPLVQPKQTPSSPANESDDTCLRPSWMKPSNATDPTHTEPQKPKPSPTSAGRGILICILSF